MARTLRWTGIACGTVLGLGIVAYALVYVLSQRLLDRDGSVMSEQARNNLSQLSDAEISALYGYLRGLSGGTRRLSADGVHGNETLRG